MLRFKTFFLNYSPVAMLLPILRCKQQQKKCKLSTKFKLKMFVGKYCCLQRKHNSKAWLLKVTVNNPQSHIINALHKSEVY